MINFHPWYSLPENQILKEIGGRLKSIRLNMNLSQKAVGDFIGKGAEEISRIEAGKPVTMVSFLRILRALNKLEVLDKALEIPDVSPIQMLQQKKGKKQRASKNRKDK